LKKNIPTKKSEKLASASLRLVDPPKSNVIPISIFSFRDLAKKTTRNRITVDDFFMKRKPHPKKGDK
jgi:hypothetical protein